MSPAIETHELCRSFAGVAAVDGLTLDARPGEVLALLGPNGAGKTTTVRLLDGVLRPDRGWSRVLGADPAVDGDAVRRRTGVLTEAAGLDDRLSGVENLVLPARVRGIDEATATRRAHELLGRLGVAALAERAVRGASTGERKRIALARALLHEPEVLFLDEPTSGLDPVAARDVVELLATLAGEHGRTVVLCTHHLAEAGRLAHRVAVLDRGRLLAFGRPADLAAELWPGVEADLDLGGAAAPATLAALRSVRGVLDVALTVDGARVRVEGRDVLPAVVAALVAVEVPVYGAVTRAPSLEDVYFALHSQAVPAVPPPAAGVPRAPSSPAEPRT